MGGPHRWVQWLVLAALHLGALNAAGQVSAPVQLAIEMRDLALVPAAVLRDTKAEVEQIFLASGVRTVWARPGWSDDPPPLTLYLVGGSLPLPRGNDDPGATIVGLAAQSGNWAQVFYGRVAAAAAERPVSISLILAHVIAHELGHLLLPPASHTPVGIMRQAVDLHHPALRRFTNDQSRLIRGSLASGERYASRCGH